jgi:hypothetical protein
LEADQKYPGDKPLLYCALPFQQQPAGFEWSFVEGMNVVLESRGERETDINLKVLAFLLIEKGAELIAWTASDGSLVMLRRGDRGAVWRA